MGNKLNLCVVARNCNNLTAAAAVDGGDGSGAAAAAKWKQQNRTNSRLNWLLVVHSLENLCLYSSGKDVTRPFELCMC